MDVLTSGEPDTGDWLTGCCIGNITGRLGDMASYSREGLDKVNGGIVNQHSNVLNRQSGIYNQQSKQISV